MGLLLDLRGELVEDGVVDPREALGAKVFSKKPPMPPAPFHTEVTTTRAEPSPAGVTRQVVTMDELRSFSTSSPSVGSLTSSRQSRIRLLVAWSFQWTRVPSPSPPSRTSYSLKCSERIFARVPL
ncbi:hypothetical protein SMD44_07030 [Streptomyces alboflavus]|uniref:Uncharacterized protein n=1 Tax=Streptomyces alboflavus TaxID=67267 RepID=A0A1Z1WMD8_9ACTN|nr:hypothetical protein SMD44_07030 [Streptomyces alboflavus]